MQEGRGRREGGGGQVGPRPSGMLTTNQGESVGCGDRRERGGVRRGHARKALIKVVSMTFLRRCPLVQPPTPSRTSRLLNCTVLLYVQCNGKVR